MDKLGICQVNITKVGIFYAQFGVKKTSNMAKYK